MFTENIQELIKFRGLLWVWSLREIRIRYKQSILGGIRVILKTKPGSSSVWLIAGGCLHLRWRISIDGLEAFLTGIVCRKGGC